MRRIHLDFAANPAANSRAGIALLVAGVLFAGLAAFDDDVKSGELEQLQYRAKRAEKAALKAEQRLATTDDAEQRNRSALAAGLSAEMANRLLSPWGGLFDAVEQAQGDDIALIRLEPDGERGRLRLAGEAKNMGALVKYVAALEGQGGIADVRLVTQQTKQEDPQHPVEFVLEGRWLGQEPAAPAPTGAKAGV